MKVHIEGNLYLESDALQFTLKEYTVTKSGDNAGKENGVVVGNYSTVHGALKDVLRMKIKESTATNLSELRTDIKRIEEWIKTQFEVELREGERVAI